MNVQGFHSRMTAIMALVAFVGIIVMMITRRDVPVTVEIVAAMVTLFSALVSGVFALAVHYGRV